jgi:DNA-binding NtrC family response regulator
MQTHQPRLFVIDDDRAVLTLSGTGVTCLDILRALRNMRPHAEVVLSTGYDSMETAIDAMKRTVRDADRGEWRPSDAGSVPGHPPTAPLVEVEREHIVRTLEQVRGNKAVAARLLGVSRRAFYRQLERHGLHHRIPTTRRDHTAPMAVE